jgi:putative transcriptional regulator
MGMSPLAPGLLVAAPPLGDPNFERSVVLLAAHGDEGAFGWVINGQQLMTIRQLVERADVRTPAPAGIPGIVRAGGPVGTEQVWLLYPTATRYKDLDDQFDVGFGITATSSRRLLEALADGEAQGPVLGVAGYAGWGPSQLEDEIRAGSWLPTDADIDILFGTDSTTTWLRAFERIGTSAMAFTSRIVGSA